MIIHFLDGRTSIAKCFSLCICCKLPSDTIFVSAVITVKQAEETNRATTALQMSQQSVNHNCAVMFQTNLLNVRQRQLPNNSSRVSNRGEVLESQADTAAGHDAFCHRVVAPVSAA